MADFKNRDVVRACELLLEKARSGELTGLLYMARVRNINQGVSALGVYAHDPEVGIAAMEEMSDILSDHTQL